MRLRSAITARNLDSTCRIRQRYPPYQSKAVAAKSPTLEDIFSELVLEQDIETTANAIVDVMKT